MRGRGGREEGGVRGRVRVYEACMQMYACTCARAYIVEEQNSKHNLPEQQRFADSRTA